MPRHKNLRPKFSVDIKPSSRAVTKSGMSQSWASAVTDNFKRGSSRKEGEGSGKFRLRHSLLLFPLLRRLLNPFFFLYGIPTKFARSKLTDTTWRYYCYTPNTPWVTNTLCASQKLKAWIKLNVLRRPTTSLTTPTDRHANNVPRKPPLLLVRPLACTPSNSSVLLTTTTGNHVCACNLSDNEIMDVTFHYQFFFAFVTIESPRNARLQEECRYIFHTRQGHTLNLLNFR